MEVCPEGRERELQKEADGNTEACRFQAACAKRASARRYFQCLKPISLYEKSTLPRTCRWHRPRCRRRRLRNSFKASRDVDAIAENIIVRR